LYKILIVDDELIEREGIKYLINKYQYDLDIVEADDGENALEYILNNPVDILFTDIRMPFMDGLELIEKAKQLRPGLKIIIFSAYGEFDYAKKAIELNVIHYILKPVDINEFKKVFSNIIRTCDEEKTEFENSQRMFEGYQKGIMYEKQKFLFDILHGISIDDALIEKMNVSGLDLDGKYIQLIMIDFKTRFFDLNMLDFEVQLRDILKWDYEYLNLNEYQSVIMIKLSKEPISKIEMSELGEKLKEWLKAKYSSEVCIVFSKLLNGIEAVSGEFYSLEQVLEYKFFYENNTVLFSGEDTEYTYESEYSVDKMIDSINQCIDSKEYNNIEERIQLLFEGFKANGNEEFSSNYVKYICAEMVKRMYKKSGNYMEGNFKEDLERIYKGDSLNRIKEIMRSIVKKVNTIEPFSDEANRKVIEVVIGIIKENYMNDISLESIAERVYLTPSYLSGLFKKKSGQSLLKYITSYRLEKAKELLQNTNMRVADIGEKIGYPNLSYFCMIFRNNYGMSPAKYREKGDLKWNY
jgi:Response regulator containing CheY-like receiver domain and AraC-type DNA-binding domain